MLPPSTTFLHQRLPRRILIGLVLCVSVCRCLFVGCCYSCNVAHFSHSFAFTRFHLVRLEPCVTRRRCLKVWKSQDACLDYVQAKSKLVKQFVEPIHGCVITICLSKVFEPKTSVGAFLTVAIPLHCLKCLSYFWSKITRIYLKVCSINHNY